MHKEGWEKEEEEDERKWSGQVEHGDARLPHRFTQEEEEENVHITSTLPFKLIHSLDTGTHHSTQH